VHRLDRETSGVLVLARQGEVHRSLNRQFETRSVKKAYLALSVGEPPWEERTVRLPLRADGDRQHRTVVDPQRGKRAITHLRVLQRFGRFTWMEVLPETGRTHQIRAHLAALKLPIAVDALYGDGRPIYLSAIKPHDRKPSERVERPLLDRLGLHAHTLTFVHPQRQEVVDFEAPLPQDLARTLGALRRYCAH
jgi:RluA family pseudouridine synthase